MDAKKSDMKKTLIKGKEYIMVHERVLFFNSEYPNGSITTVVTFHESYVRAVTTVTPDIDKPLRIFTGHAEEDRTQGMINKTNAVENVETSAVGRALAMMGIGIIEGIASADEVNHAIHKQTSIGVKAVSQTYVPTAPSAYGSTSTVKKAPLSWKPPEPPSPTY